MAVIQMELPSGAILAMEVDTQEGMQYAAGKSPEDLQQKAFEAFQQGISKAGEVAGIVQQRLDSAGLRYSEAELSFGLTLTAGIDVKVVKGEGQGILNLTVRWQADGGTS